MGHLPMSCDPSRHFVLEPASDIRGAAISCADPTQQWPLAYASQTLWSVGWAAESAHRVWALAGCAAAAARVRWHLLDTYGEYYGDPR